MPHSPDRRREYHTGERIVDFGTLHPVSVELVRDYLSSAEAKSATLHLVGQGRPASRHMNALTYGLAVWLTQRAPVFAGDGFSLTAWEARVDRGLGMMLRPPSRLFLDAGFDEAISRSLDIRLDMTGTAMGGAYIPPHLIDQSAEVVDRHLERSVRRMIEAEMDATNMQCTLTEALRYASANQHGLYEASGVLDPYDSGSWPQGSQVVTGSKDKELLERISRASEPDKEEGLVRRSLRKLGLE